MNKIIFSTVNEEAFTIYETSYQPFQTNVIKFNSASVINDPHKPKLN